MVTHRIQIRLEQFLAQSLIKISVVMTGKRHDDHDQPMSQIDIFRKFAVNENTGSLDPADQSFGGKHFQCCLHGFLADLKVFSQFILPRQTLVRENAGQDFPAQLIRNRF